MHELLLSVSLAGSLCVNNHFPYPISNHLDIDDISFHMATYSLWFVVNGGGGGGGAGAAVVVIVVII